jgi:hypothetical protein
MPSGGSTAMPDDAEWEKVIEIYEEAVKHGLQYEWLSFFVGGIVNDKKTPAQAAYDAAIEWDF